MTKIMQKAKKPQKGVMGDGPLIWVVSDGTAGMVAQSLALVQALNVDYYDVRIFASPIYRLFPQMGNFPLMPISPRRNDRRLGPPWPDIVVTCGSRTTGACLAMKRLSGGKTKIVQIQDPRIDPANFDVMIVPKHDPVSDKDLENIIVSTGSLNRLTMTNIAQAAKALDKSYKRIKNDKTAVMIGGNNRRYKPSMDDFSAFAKSLSEFAKKQKRHLILIGSRRTPKGALDMISAELGAISHQIWDGKTDNPYPGILGLVDDIIVTSDSVNMASEACITGKPVYVAQLCPETGRIADFHNRMIAEGYVKPLGDYFDKPPEILDEMSAIAAQVRDKLGL